VSTSPAAVLRRCGAAISAATISGVLVITGAAGPEVTPARSTAAQAPTDLPLRLASATTHRRWPGHPGRVLVSYRVHRGDTATALAVRFHAWTRELKAVNHLGRHGRVYVGQRLRIPVVTAAARHHRPHHRATHHRHRPWRNAYASRAKVRRVVVSTARRHHVDPHLALAVAWEESGWQQHRISGAHAVGAMQVLHGTARWMSGYVGRRLNVYSLRDNVTAGVVLLRILGHQASYRGAIASYYQGLGSVRRHGMYPSTRAYTRDVVALHRRLRRGWNPA
jgi:LysM repeat protein